MKGYNTLLMGSILSKLFGIIVFIILARLLKPGELGVIALIPSVALIVFSLFSFGIVTSMEREVPKCLMLDRKDGESILCGCSILLFLVVVISFTATAMLFEELVIILDNSFLDSVGYFFLAPVFFFLALHSFSIIFKLSGDLKSYWLVRYLSDLISKVVAILMYMYDSSLESLMIGSVIGYLPFIILAIYKISNFGGVSFRYGIKKIDFSIVYYVESLFNTAKVYGDPVIISLIMNPGMVGAYYVSKRMSEQMEALLQPVQAMVVPLFSQKYSESDCSFKNFVLSSLSVGEFFLWVSVSMSLVAPYLLFIIGGDAYSSYVIASVVLSLSLGFFHFNTILGRSILFLGDRHSRFLLSVVHFFLVLIVAIPLSKVWGLNGYAIGVLCSQLMSVLLSFFVITTYKIGKFSYRFMIVLILVGCVLNILNLLVFYSLGISAMSLIMLFIFLLFFMLIYVIFGNVFVFESLLPRIIGMNILAVKRCINSYIKCINKF